MLIICDFDGTVTARDTNSTLARRFAPDTFAGLEGKLGRRELTLREVLSAEFRDVRVGLDAMLEVAMEIPLRDGFEQFLDAADEHDATVVLLSSGFREFIEPMLHNAGLHGRVPLVANSIRLDETGGHVTWRDLPECDLCGEPCKRHDVAQLRAEHATPETTVVFVGDGFSDRCGAESADRVFARDSLASYLDKHGHAYEAWDDFTDVMQMLGFDRAEAAR